jgi:hypothetical protein
VLADTRDVGGSAGPPDDLEQLATGLHDGPLQVLYAVGLDLQLAEHLVAAGDDPGPALATARRQLQQAVDELRGLLRALRAGDVAAGLHAVSRAVGPTVTCEVDEEAAGRLGGARGVELVVAASTVAAHQRRRAGGATPLRIGLGLDHGDVVLELEGVGVGDDEVVADLGRRTHRLAGTLAATPDHLALRVPA